MSPNRPLRDALSALGRRFDLAELYVFGSRAAEVAARVQGTADPTPGAGTRGVDVDIGVRPHPGRRFDVDAAVELTGALESLLDVDRVDLVLLPSAPPFLALDVIRGELIYCADAHAQAEYELYVLSRAGDLAPFQRARHELVLSRWMGA